MDWSVALDAYELADARDEASALDLVRLAAELHLNADWLAARLNMPNALARLDAYQAELESSARVSPTGTRKTEEAQ